MRLYNPTETRSRITAKRKPTIRVIDFKKKISISDILLMKQQKSMEIDFERDITISIPFVPIIKGEGDE